MRRNIFTRNKKGFSLIELCIVIGLMAILVGSITPVFIKRVQVKAGEKTAQEMSVIQQAALSYYVANNAWPVSIQVLQSEGYLNPSWNTVNPWQNAYTISSNAASFTVSTSVPEEWTALVARDLPTSSMAGTIVSSSVPAPGSMPDDSLAVGSIIMWSGSIASIPSGWQLCDGTNGTPDLRGRFILGVSSGENPGATGGSSTHTHSGTVGASSQMIWIDDNSGGTDYWGSPSSHTHPLTIDAASHLPPYYKLAYIMKMQ
jgi:prepilin-type N-terminal cleavage/methylation domain-containing protein